MERWARCATSNSSADCGCGGNNFDYVIRRSIGGTASIVKLRVAEFASVGLLINQIFNTVGVFDIWRTVAVTGGLLFPQ
jgi:hypothetical protein